MTMKRPSIKIIALCLLLFVASSIYSNSHSRRVRFNNKSVRTRAQYWPPSFPRLPLVDTLSPFATEKLAHHATNKVKQSSKFAFATFLTDHGTEALKDDTGSADYKSRGPSDQVSGIVDGYYTSARVLAYSLLHHGPTRVQQPIPFLVLHTHDVSSQKLARLKADGAILVPAYDETSENRNSFKSKDDRPDLDASLTPKWIHEQLGSEPWHDVLAKLKLFTLTQYDKICFIDADTLVTERLDGVFQDPATVVRHTSPTYNRTAVRIDQGPSVRKQSVDQDDEVDADDLPRGSKHSNGVPTREDEAPLPKSYMLAGKMDILGYDHPVPPPPFDSSFSPVALPKSTSSASDHTASPPTSISKSQGKSNAKSDHEKVSSTRKQRKVGKSRLGARSASHGTGDPHGSSKTLNKSTFVENFRRRISASTKLSSELDTSPIAGDDAYLNSGFFVFRPCMTLYKYYLSVLTIPGRFDPQYPDQNLLNYAHRRGSGVPYEYKPSSNDKTSFSTDSAIDRTNAEQEVGAMPWTHLDWKWNALWPTARDLEAGVRSFHGKLWENASENDEVVSSKDDAVLREMWWKRVREMEEFFGSKDGVSGGLH